MILFDEHLSPIEVYGDEWREPLIQRDDVGVISDGNRLSIAPHRRLPTRNAFPVEGRLECNIQQSTAITSPSGIVQRIGGSARLADQSARHSYASALYSRDGLDLYQEPVMEFLGGNDGACGAMIAEELGVDRVDPAPQRDISDVDRRLEHMADVTPSGLQDRGDVLEGLFGLLLN